MRTATDRSAAPVADSTLSPAETARRSERESRRWRIALVAPLVVGLPWIILAALCGFHSPLQGVNGAILALLVVITTATDLTWRRIPNWATYTAAVWGLSLALVALAIPDAWTVRVPFIANAVPVPRLLAGVSLGEAAGGFAVGFGVMLLLYGVFQGGAGDVKLAGALGVLVGTDRILNALIYGYIVAGVTVACWLVLTLGPGGLFREVVRGLGGKPDPTGTVAEGPVLHRKLAMAPFLNIGVVLVLFW